MPLAPGVSITQHCRLCGGSLPYLEPVLDWGPLQVSAFPLPGEATTTAPLTLKQCPKCNLVQLGSDVDPSILFAGDYWYASGINGLMREELRNVVREARGWVRVHEGDWVMDTGANDGTLLQAWHEYSWESRPIRVAVEPSPTFAKPLAEAAEVVLQETFPQPTPVDKPDAGTFKVITSIAMFYAVPDPVGFAREVARLLHPEGVWIVQMQDLRNMIRQTAFDNICHEHVAYYDVQTFWQVCVRAGLRIVSYTPREINGGSLRFVVMHEPNKEQTKIFAPPPVLPADLQPVDWRAFFFAVHARLQRLRDVVQTARDMGHTVDLLGASTKGNTLLQLARLEEGSIRQCWERHPGKFGRTTVTGIPIVPERQGRGALTEDPPDLLVCPIWQFRRAVVEREDAYLRTGGRIYFPLPEGELFSR